MTAALSGHRQDSGQMEKPLQEERKPQQGRSTITEVAHFDRSFPLQESWGFSTILFHNFTWHKQSYLSS